MAGLEQAARAAREAAPLIVRSIYEIHGSVRTSGNNCAMIFPPSSDTIDVQVGPHSLYRVGFYPAGNAPSLIQTLLRKHCPTCIQALQLYLMKNDSSAVEIRNEKQWQEIGWERARKVYEEGKALGDRQAAAFHVGPLKCSHSRSSYI
ncbi:hypothetical protein JCM11641_007316 [Rhodosporidiobolus odoratus]